MAVVHITLRKSRTPSDVSPPRDHLPLANGDSGTFPNGCCEIFVGTGGTLTLTMNGNAVPYKVPDGTFITGDFTAYALGTAQDVVARL